MKNRLILSCLMMTSFAAFSQLKQSLDFLTKETNAVALQNKIKTLGAGDEKDKWLLMNYYESKKDLMRADSLLKATVVEFPLGQLAYIQLANKIVSETDVVKKEIIAAQILKDFPNADKNRIHHSLAYGYAAVKNIPKVIENINALNTQRARFSATLIVTKLIMNYDLPAAESLIRAQIDEVVAAGVPAPPLRNGDTGATGDARPSYFLFLEMYTNILVKQGKYEEALKYAKDVYAESKGKKDELTGNYGVILSKTGSHQQAVDLLEKLILAGRSNQMMKDAFKVSYTKQNPGRDAVEYLSQLENGMKDKIEADVVKLLINEPAPLFTLKDANGKIVSLADFKGKTIVLDFWATWCMPCIASFPAMQMAVDKYKNDPKVEFLFVHTWERVEDPLSDARKFMTTNNYRLALFMDTKDPQTKANPVVSAFGVKGIPAKFVIDGNGRIRFRITGFSGGNDAALAELSAMIDVSKRGV